MKAVQHELVALRAYEIWECAGCPDGLDKEHWEQAERELLEAAPEIKAETAVEPDAKSSRGRDAKAVATDVSAQQRAATTPSMGAERP